MYNVVCSSKVDVPRPPPVGRIAVRDRSVLLDVSGIVDHDVQSSESLLHFLDCSNNLVVLRDVNGQCEDLEWMAGPLHGNASGFDLREIRPGEEGQSPCAGLGYGQCGGLSDTSRCTSEDNHFPTEICLRRIDSRVGVMSRGGNKSLA